MPSNTYVALDTRTLASAASSVTFTGINQNYTDLVLISSINSARGVSLDSVGIQFNSDTTTNYSYTLIQGNTSSGATSGRGTNATDIFVGNCAASSVSNNFSLTTTQIMNYKSTSTFKTILSRGGALVSAVKDTEAIVGLWRKSPEAITSITILSETGSNFNIGSTFNLYGILAEGVSPAPKATGGVVSSDSTYYYHTFASSGTFTPNQTISCDYFMVAGGGGAGATTGGGWAGGGGGAGGYRTFTSTSFTATAYAITVGGGGSGGSGSGGTGAKGGNSSLIGGAISTTTTGGGGGGTTEVNGSTKTNGQPGGSGGGGAQTQTSVSGGAGNEGGYTPVEGYAGRSTTNNPGQGGGAGGVGLDSVYGTVPTPNGVTAFNSNYYASGGYCLNVATGSQNALAFTGNGGSSRNDGTGVNVAGGNGGSGVVVIRYAKA